mmetsp:Transcript_33733/g.100620  ORF Transcript_33733/g.100620 Transcript_33733/m.100620 type:complete len:254 (+) Transcript_33733:623-1384(+)
MRRVPTSGQKEVEGEPSVPAVHGGVSDTRVDAPSASPSAASAPCPSSKLGGRRRRGRRSRRRRCQSSPERTADRSQVSEPGPLPHHFAVDAKGSPERDGVRRVPGAYGRPRRSARVQPRGAPAGRGRQRRRRSRWRRGERRIGEGKRDERRRPRRERGRRKSASRPSPRRGIPYHGRRGRVRRRGASSGKREALVRRGGSEGRCPLSPRGESPPPHALLRLRRTQLRGEYIGGGTPDRVRRSFHRCFVVAVVL